MLNRKKTTIKLNCGIEAEQTISSGKEWLDISLMPLYEGYGKGNNFELLSKLFLELHLKGFEGHGLSREVLCYDSTNDIILKCSKNL